MSTSPDHEPEHDPEVDAATDHIVSNTPAARTTSPWRVHVVATPSTAEHLVTVLSGAGYAVTSSPILAPNYDMFDVLLIDVSPLDGKRADEVVELLSQQPRPQIPVVVFSSTADVVGALDAFEAGADELLTSGFTDRELLARLTHLRDRREPADSVTLSGGRIVLNVLHRRVIVRGRRVAVTRLEFDLLAFFLMHPDEPLSRERLLREVWGFDSGPTTTVTVHVRRLREKIEDDPMKPMLLQTVWGLGYRFVPSK